MRPLAIIPARTGSRGIPEKNHKSLGGRWTPTERAIQVAREAGCRVFLTTDAPALVWPAGVDDAGVDDIYRQTSLHTDTSAMIDIVKDALSITEESLILLLQPTQPLRTVDHVRKAIEFLTATPRPDSVVSVVQVPVRYHPLYQICTQSDGKTQRFRRCMGSLVDFPARRQTLEAEPTYIRDGTVYGFWRETVEKYGNIYGLKGVPLIIPPHETSPLDTLEDWKLAEQLLQARAEVH